MGTFVLLILFILWHNKIHNNCRKENHCNTVFGNYCTDYVRENTCKNKNTCTCCIVKRLITFVIAKRPNFWLKDVIGIHPKHAESELTKPSQARLPEISFSVASRPSAMFVNMESVMSHFIGK